MTAEKEPFLKKRNMIISITIMAIGVATWDSLPFWLHSNHTVNLTSFHKDLNQLGQVQLADCKSDNGWTFTNSEKPADWKRYGDIQNNETAWSIVSQKSCAILLTSQENITKSYRNNLKTEYGMTESDLDQSFFNTGDKLLPYTYYYNNTKTSLQCLYYYDWPIDGKMIQKVTCDNASNHVIEHKLSNVVSLEFNRQYYAEGLNRMSQLIGLGYTLPSMTEVPSTTWDGKDTTKYIVVLENKTSN